MRAANTLVAFFVEGGPVGYAGVEETDVYVVEMVRRVYPFAAAVVGFEAEVWGRWYALTAGKVGALAVM